MSKIEIHLSQLVVGAAGSHVQRVRGSPDGPVAIEKPLAKRPKFGPHIKAPKRKVRMRQLSAQIRAQQELVNTPQVTLFFAIHEFATNPEPLTSYRLLRSTSTNIAC